MTATESIVQLAERAPLPRMHSGADMSHRWGIAGYPEAGKDGEHVLYQCGCGQTTTRDRKQLLRAIRDARR